MKGNNQCSCLDRELCKEIETGLERIGETSMVGCIRLRKEKGAQLTAATEIRKNFIDSAIRLVKMKGLDSKFIAYHHFHPEVVRQWVDGMNAGAEDRKSNFPKTVSSEIGNNLGFHERDRVSRFLEGGEGRYLNVPDASWYEHWKTWINNVGTYRAIERTKEKGTPSSSSSSSNQEIVSSLKLSANQKATLTSTENEIQIKNAEDREEKSAKKQKLETEEEKRASVISSMSREQKELFHDLEKQFREERKKTERLENTLELRDKEDIVNSQEWKRLNAYVATTMTRFNITDPEWHVKNNTFAKYFLGYKSWSEFIIYFKSYWPDIETNIHISDGEDSQREIVPFERAIITVMFMRKALEYETLGKIWGRDRTVIGRYVDAWAPLWAEVGNDKSDVDLTPNIMDSLYPEDFLQGLPGMKVAALVDGKDYQTNTLRSQGAVTRALYSDKVHHAAVRQLSWILPNGMNVTHGKPYLGNASESKHVEKIGSVIGVVPTEKVDDMKMNILNDTKKRQTINWGKDSTDDNGLSPEELGEKIKELEKSLPNPNEPSSDTDNDNDNGDGDGDGDDDGDDGVSNPPDHLKKVFDWFDERKKVLESSAEDGIEARRKAKIYLTDDLKTFDEELLRSGPNESPERKLLQLQRLGRLDVEFENGNLSLNLLSDYLKATREHRFYLQQLLEKGDVTMYYETNEEIPLNSREDIKKKVTVPVGLGKFPRTWWILGDKGFANDATRYPNLNPQLTSHFLGERPQLPSHELTDDQVQAMLRYISETNFARVTNWKLLIDVIDYHYLKHTQDVIDWAHGHANLLQPYKERQYTSSI